MSAVAVAGLTLFSMMGQMLLESVGNLKMRQAIPIPAQILAGIVLWLTTLWEIPFVEVRKALRQRQQHRYDRKDRKE